MAMKLSHNGKKRTMPDIAQSVLQDPEVETLQSYGVQSLRSNVCWVCMRVFGQVSDTYNHMKAEHGSFDDACDTTPLRQDRTRASYDP